MTLKTRLTQLEKIRNPEPEAKVFIYYHYEDGYAATWNGQHFPTLDELAAAQGWEIHEQDTQLEIVYASNGGA